MAPGRRHPHWPAQTTRAHVLGFADAVVLIGVGVACGTSWAIGLTLLGFWWVR
jgi:hypothetical protein